MWYVSKICAGNSYQNMTELPFYGAFGKSYLRDVKFRLDLTDSQTSERMIMLAQDFAELLSRVVPLNPYGYYSRLVFGNDEKSRYHHLVSISKYALHFLDYVESVELVKKSDLDFAFDSNVLIKVDIAVDEYSTLLTCCLERSGDIREIDCSLFDALCMTRNPSRGSYCYLQAVVNVEDILDESYVYRVSFSNPLKAQSMIARGKTLRSTLFQEFWDFGTV